jgi:hypothetical protein
MQFDVWNKVHYLCWEFVEKAFTWNAKSYCILDKKSYYTLMLLFATYTGCI